MRDLRSVVMTLVVVFGTTGMGCGDDSGGATGADTSVGADTVVASDTAVVSDTTVVSDTGPTSDTGIGDTSTATDSGGGGDTATDTAPSDVAPDGEICTPACATDAKRCDDDGKVVLCETDDTGCTVWGTPTACDGGDVCLAGDCVAPCVASDTRCLDDATLQRCDAGALEVVGCPYGCDQTVSACRGCPTGGWQCADDGGGSFLLQVCPTGESWDLVAQCQTCACAAGTPVAMQCLGQDDTQTACAACGDDGLSCNP